MSCFIFRCLALAILCCFFSPARSSFSAEAEVATEYWPPFRMKGPSGDIFGLDVDLMHLIGERMGVDFEFRWYPWPRCLLNMKEGQTDFMSGLAKSPDREEYIIYSSVPYHSCSPRFYALKGNGKKVKSYNDLYDYTIAYCRDSKYFEPFNSDGRLLKEDKDNERTMLRVLVKGRVDLIVGTDCQVEHDVHEMGLENMIEETDYKPESPVNLYIGVSKKSPYADRIEELDAVLRALLKEGAMDELRLKYFPFSKTR